jgi:hypothetical protein
MSLELRGTVSATGSSGRSTAGYVVAASLTFEQRVAEGAEGTVVVPAGGSARVAEDKTFRMTIESEGDPREPVDVRVSAPDGTEVFRHAFALADVEGQLKLRVPTIEKPEIEAAEDPTTGTRPTLTGRVVDAKGRETPPNLPVVIWTAAGGGDLQPDVFTSTQPGGFFSAVWPSHSVGQAEGRVADIPGVPIRLNGDGHLPREILLVLDLGELVDPEFCACNEPPPRAPEPTDLVRNPSAFSQDLGVGCVDLTTPNRVIEEFTYRFVIRTSEPRVKGVTLGVRAAVPPQLLSDLLGVSMASEALSSRRSISREAAAAIPLTLDVRSAKRLVRADRPPTLAEVSRAAWLSEVSSTKTIIDAALRNSVGRTDLDANNAIDWDDTPTIHESIELAFGHVLHMREVWRADGYSLGDLLYSLPLAPGQRRQLAVVDWERTTVSERAEVLEFEEQLESFLNRDRDVREIVGTNLHEETAGGSRSTTWGAAGGIGVGFIGSGFGIFGGVAGGYSSSRASAWQRSARDFSASSFQRLQDRVSQRASALRDERTTVVQSVAQGETLRAETEVVANYNRCHAITIEYFEVLRHFLISHELADVTECLFVPFPLEEFDRGKALRWREPLSRFLRDRTLRDGFDALLRIASDWVGWDYPESRYSQEAPESLEGELRISFVLPRPRDAQDGTFQYAEWLPYRNFLGIDLAELFRQMLGLRTPQERDVIFRREVAPQIAENLVGRLRFAYVTRGGGEVEVPLDPTLVSRYSEGVPLYVTLSPRGALPAIPREDINYFKVWYDGDALPPDARVLVHSGRMRYRAAHSTALLFDSPRWLDDLRTGDPAIVSTPLSYQERRDPRAEDRRLADRLVAHLNEHLEFYHQTIWILLDPQRRYMLLDAIVVPDLNGASVASVCTNELIGIVGNSLVLPAAPGRRLDPTVEVPVVNGNGTPVPVPLRDAYAADAPPPLRVSVPTRGVYAEAISGECNACETPDETRYWRWSTEGLLAPPRLEEVSTETRAQPEPDLTPSPLPTPLVSIQNAPAAPPPVGLAGAFELLAAKNVFADITGLEGSQKNAMAAFEASMSAAAALGQEASKLAGQNELGRNAERMIDRIQQAQKDDLLTPQAAEDLTRSALQGLIGEDRQKAGVPEKDEAVKKSLESAASAKNASVKISSPSETVEVSYDNDGPIKVGAGTKAVTGSNPGWRACCALGQWELGAAGALDPTKLAGHRYAAASGPTGYVYSPKVGLIDFGHLRDCADMMKFIHDALVGGFTTLDLYEGEAVVSAIPAKADERLDLAAAITYVESWAHELQTWDDYSSFSPEDIPSNIMGIEVGRRAIKAGGAFDAAVDKELDKLVNTEFKGRSKADTDAVLTKIKNVWYKTTIGLIPLALLRRNFDGVTWPAGMPYDAPTSFAWLTPAAFKPRYSKFTYKMFRKVDGKSGVTLATMQTETDALHKKWTTAHPGMDKP